ncbi:MAG: zinc ribbon domain-containing protein [Acidobacteriota bacterium]
MAEPKLEREVCVNCGAEVRPDTQFCYSCGKSVSKKDAARAEVVPAQTESSESLAALERALAVSRTEDAVKTKLDTAAVERKRARSGNRKPLEIVWEPLGPSIVYFIAVAVLFILAAIVVFVSLASR